jgi:hypothetical protein
MRWSLGLRDATTHQSCALEKQAAASLAPGFQGRQLARRMIIVVAFLFMLDVTLATVHRSVSGGHQAVQGRFPMCAVRGIHAKEVNACY